MKYVIQVFLIVFSCLIWMDSKANNDPIIAFSSDSLMKVVKSDLSPFDFGLAKAKSDTDRFYALYNTHVAALAAGVNVDYSGIDTIDIAIPMDAQRIPLTLRNDFSGAVFRIKNNSKQFVLFEMIRSSAPINIDKNMLDGCDYSSIPELSKGLCMLILEDKTPWVNQRRDHSYPAIRKDLIFLSDGKAQNSPIASYQTESTKPECSYYYVTPSLKTIQNITILRDSSATYITKCFYIVGENNVLFKNVAIYTPASTMVADEAIIVNNCANVAFKDVTIEGSYSQIARSGYGISMNNVWNSEYVRLIGHANWGIFGTNNISKASFTNCDINRFDIHCYGGDISFSDCEFHNMFNQFSSIYGLITFDKCHFSQFAPVLFETSYNAYTGFDLVLNDCVFDVKPRNNYLISAGLVDNQINLRPELIQKRWPNIQIQNLTINIPDSISKVVIFYPKDPISPKVNIGYISNISINKLQVNYSGNVRVIDLYISSSKVNVANPVNCTINKIKMYRLSKSNLPDKSDELSQDLHFHSKLIYNNKELPVKIRESKQAASK